MGPASCGLMFAALYYIDRLMDIHCPNIIHLGPRWITICCQELCPNICIRTSNRVGRLLKRLLDRDRPISDDEVISLTSWETIVAD